MSEREEDIKTAKEAKDRTEQSCLLNSLDKGRKIGRKKEREKKEERGRERRQIFGVEENSLVVIRA